MMVYDYIITEIDKTTRFTDKSDGSVIPLPYPYSVPCVKDTFLEMYYWDTYFTNKGLLLTGRRGQAVNNVYNLSYLLDKFGKIPNGNRAHYVGRSQPPFFGLMLYDIEKGKTAAGDYKKFYRMLKKEYDFWTEKRITENGLSSYGCDMTEKELLGNYGVYREIHTEKYAERTGVYKENTPENAGHVIAEYESGWDFTPRFNGRCADFNAIDLNSLLFADEMLLADFAARSGKKSESELFLIKAEERREKINKLCLSDGIYYDYDKANGRTSEVISCASLFPFFTLLSDDRNAFIKTLSRLEREHGVAAAVYENTEGNYQWAEPNGWAPLNYVAAKAAFNLGLTDSAKRIAIKYIRATDNLFEKTGALWEKYNVITGGIEVSSEYGTPEMLGWSAGVYIAFTEFIKSGFKKLI